MDDHKKQKQKIREENSNAHPLIGNYTQEQHNMRI